VRLSVCLSVCLSFLLSFFRVAFGVPLAYFLARGRIPPHLRGRLAALFALGGTQGLVGAWMVQSGLDMDPQQRKEIRVSPYRLATHLGLAFTTYTLLVWTSLDVLRPLKPSLLNLTSSAGEATSAAAAKAATASPASVAELLKPRVGLLRGASVLTAGLVFTTALSGAFVAGNDAGRAFNTFPKMDGDWVPPGALKLEPAWRNFFENTAAVQLDHRLLALASTTSVAATLALALKPLQGGQAVWKHLPAMTRGALVGMGGMVAVQVGLGISTLLLYVPIELAAAHQFGSLVLLTFSTAAAHSLRGFAFSPGPVAAAGIGALSVPIAALLSSSPFDHEEIAK
jgi:cytochrome c oxidase assembly protein subunit 15